QRLGQGRDVAPQPRLRGGGGHDPRLAGDDRGQQADAAGRGRTVQRRRLLRHARAPHLRPAARAPNPLRGRAGHAHRGRTTMMRPDGDARRHFGLYPAIVVDIVDPDNLGRIQVRFPWLGQPGNDDVRAWATLLTPYADDDQGYEFLPAVDSQVVVG